MGGIGTGGVLEESDINALKAEARRRLEDSQNDSAINSCLHQELALVDGRNVDLLGRYLDVIQDAFNAENYLVERLELGGSVAKHTYVDGLSDVDALVVLEKRPNEDPLPEEARGRLVDTLRRGLPRADVRDIREGTLAVTVGFMDGMEVQLLPAVAFSGGVAIASSDGNSWSPIRPFEFATSLIDANRDRGGRVVPVIKLAKAIFANNKDEFGISGYHVEALAIEAFRNYSESRTPKAMVAHLVRYASQRVLTPIGDVTGQSPFVDEYLGAENSPARVRLSRNLTALTDIMSHSRSPGDWMGLFH